jgi:transposase
LKELKKKELKDFRTSIEKKLTRLEKLMDKSIINYFNTNFFEQLEPIRKQIIRILIRS